MGYVTIIPTANLYNLSVCVSGLRQNDSHSPIIVVEDGVLTGPSTLPHGHYLKGQSPFIYARNINAGIVAAGDRDVILMNDDAVLVTGTITQLMDKALELGCIVSASVRGAVNNPEQQERKWDYSNFPRESLTRVLNNGYLAFVCVAIPRNIIYRIGMLDERFITYGGEDVDYCHRAIVEDIPLAVCDGCVVDHGNILTSTFRRLSVPDIEYGLRILRGKWARIQNTPLPI